MNIAEILKASADGDMPLVTSKKPISGTTHTTGRVVVIKKRTIVSGYSGIAVSFPGLTYDTWFYEGSGTDGRSKYMDDLEFQN